MSKATLLGIPDLIRGLEWIYLLVWIALGALAVWLPPNWKAKLGAALLVLIAGGALPVYLSLQIKQEVAIQRPIVEKRNAQLEAAMARFEERCKTAGEKIYRTVDDVEGILLLRVIPIKPTQAGADPLWQEAGVPDRRDDDYLMSFLRNTELQPEYKDPEGKPLYPSSVGYQFVDVLDEAGKSARYVAPYQNNNQGEKVQKLIKKSAGGAVPKFGVTYEAFVDPEDRKYWIAGGSIRIIDLLKNEVIAEKTGYLIDPGQGSTSGSRDPWGWAHSYGQRCPKNWGQGTPARSFADQVLKPKKGE